MLKRGIPTVVLVTERFRELAEATRLSRGLPDAPSVVLPVTEATEYGGKDVMTAIADDALRAVVEILTAGGKGNG